MGLITKQRIIDAKKQFDKYAQQAISVDGNMIVDFKKSKKICSAVLRKESR